MMGNAPIAIHGAAIDRACEDDKRWFAERPERLFRLRTPVDFEFNQPFPMTLRPDHGGYVLVARLKDARARTAISLGPPYHQWIEDGTLALDAAPDELLRPIFERSAPRLAHLLLPLS
jgi:hypothetical protein